MSTAYSVLINPDARSTYDESLDSTRIDFIPTGLSQSESEMMFMQEMINLASELTMINLKHRKIAKYLTKAGCPEAVASRIALEIENARKRFIKAQAKQLIPKILLKGGLSLGGLIIGLLLLTGSITTIGTIISALSGLLLLNYCYQLIRTFYFRISGKAPVDWSEVATRLFKS